MKNVGGKDPRGCFHLIKKRALILNILYVKYRKLMVPGNPDFAISISKGKYFNCISTLLNENFNAFPPKKQSYSI